MTANNHGGKREGAGRPRGATTRKTREVADRAAREGVTPLEYMLKVLRSNKSSDAQKAWAAEKAAPYLHPKLSAVDHKSSDGTMTPKPDRIVIVAADGNGGD